jgi:hypothetical protein
MKIKNFLLPIPVEKHGLMNVIHVLVIIQYICANRKSVEDHVLMKMVILMIMIVNGLVQMDVTLVNVQMEKLIVLKRNVLFVGTIIYPTNLEMDGKMDVFLVVVMKMEQPSVLILVFVKVMMIVKKDISVISHLVKIPLVLVTNVPKKTAAYLSQFVVVMVTIMHTHWRLPTTMLL